MSNVTEENLIDIRRHLHRNPELSTEEHATADFIEERLKSFGLNQIDRVGETGVVAVIEGDTDGPVLGWRADIDALPILEKNQAAYSSENEGVMHACGHDVHTTVGLGIAAQLYRKRDQLAGTVKMIFQPAEEADPGGEETVGAEKMIELGVLESPEVDAMFALHCMPALEAGKIGYTEGPVWANSNAFDITINGTSAHGAYPHQGVDAIHVASELTVALQSIPSRRVDARESSVVSVGRIEGGDSFNVLADKARIKGIFRSFSDEVSNNIEESIRRLASQISESQGATADIDISKGARAVINDRDTVRSAVDALESDGEKQIVRHEPQLGAEDFASFSRRVPSAYMFLGIRGDDRGHYGLHSPKFDVDERCIQFGVDRFSEMLKGLGKQDI